MSERARPRAAMILAAGRGERMRPLTDHVPKPLLQVRGQALIERHVRALVGAGIAELVINLAWLGGMIRGQLGDGSRYGARITYSDESAGALETAGGIIRALPHLEPGPFAVVNGDVYTDYPFENLGIAKGLHCHLVMVPNPPQHPGGDFGIEGDLAVDRPQPRYTYSGVSVYRREFFAGLAPGVRPLKPLWLQCMAQRRCGAELYLGRWEDVGTPQRLAALNA